MFVVTENDLDTFKPSEQAITLDGRPFGMVKNPEPDKFAFYRYTDKELTELMEIATFPTLESLQRSLSSIEGVEYVKSS